MFVTFISLGVSLGMSLSLAQTDGDDGALSRIEKDDQKAIIAQAALKASEVFADVEEHLGKEKTADLFVDSMKRAHAERAEGLLKAVGTATEEQAKEGLGTLKLVLKEAGTASALRILRNVERNSADSRSRLREVIAALREADFKTAYSKLLAEHDGSIAKMLRSQGEALQRVPDIAIPGICLRGWLDFVDSDLKKGAYSKGNTFGWATLSILVVPTAILGDMAILTFAQAPYWFVMSIYGVCYALYSVGYFVYDLVAETETDRNNQATTISNLKEQLEAKERELEDLRRRARSVEGTDSGEPPTVRR